MFNFEISDVLYVTSLLHNRKPALYSLPFFFISSQLVFRRRCMDLFVYSPICCCFCDVTTLTNKVHANIYKCAHTRSVAFSRGMRSSKVTFLVCIVLRPNSWTKYRQKSSEFFSLLFTVTSTALH
jgi:hypothetical protein